MTQRRNVYLGKLCKSDSAQCQWSVRVGDQWTECDIGNDGSLVTINGGTPGGWFGWGARSDGPLVTGHVSRCGVTLEHGHVALGYTDMSDEAILEFNKIFVHNNQHYR